MQSFAPAQEMGGGGVPRAQKTAAGKAQRLDCRACCRSLVLVQCCERDQEAGWHLECCQPQALALNLEDRGQPLWSHRDGFPGAGALAKDRQCW